ncbi:NAD-dependent epimerase/dehydratase family protein [Sphingobium sp.]|uniref:NAD-dependent epimerase/dehydratase family protein n=1 Tax=Sphingobium sp. TaxID=1912891 RepID=UPI0035C74EE3
MRVAITGGDGFIGRAVVRHLLGNGMASADLLLIDRAFARPPRSRHIAGDLLDQHILSQAVAECDALLHLAALPGAASEQDPALAHRINVDLPLRLIEAMAGRRLILAGSIAVFGSAPPEPVDDDSPVRPDSVYGTCKARIELAFADAIGQNVLHGAVLRLPAVVARPAAAGGFGSAWMSDMFHAARNGVALRLPVARDATCWLASLDVTARNLAHAITTDFGSARPVTLPALHVRIGDLTDRLSQRFGYRGFSHAENPIVRRMFGCYPLLTTPLADSLGFSRDVDLAMLIDTVFSTIAHDDASSADDAPAKAHVP